MSSLSVLLCLSLCMPYRWRHSCQSVCPSVNSYISVLLLWVTVLEYWPLPVIGLHHPTYWQYACNVYSGDTTLPTRAKTHGSPRSGGSVQWRSGRMPPELHTGAAASVISEVTYKTLWKGKCNEWPPLKHTNALLRTYTGERLRILGWIASISRLAPDAPFHCICGTPQTWNNILKHCAYLRNGNKE